MKNVFVDTNILIDLLADRRPFSKFAIEIFDLADKKKINLFTSSHSIATTHYVLKKYIKEQELRDVLYSLLDYLDVVSIDVSIIKKSLLSRHPDLEDAIQIFAAHSIKNLDFIVTRNVNDFKEAELPVLPPDELLLHLI
jgi:predicted nucleic acid-binding protein